MFIDKFNRGDTDGAVFFVHNLGRFDSVFLLKALCHCNDLFEIRPMWKDNSILRIKIK